MSKSSGIQYRATCPICFREHALKGERMVQHGYERPEGWHANIGVCDGYNKPHFGTPEGKQWASAHADAIESYATRCRGDLEKHKSGQVKEFTVTEGPRHARRSVTVKQGEYRYDQKLRSAIWRIEQQIRSADDHVAYVRQRVAEWKPAAPVKVEVEKRGPVVHGLRSGRQACAGPFSRGMGNISKDWTQVTCSRCLKWNAAYGEQYRKREAEQRAARSAS